MKKIVIVKKGVTVKAVAKTEECCASAAPTKIR